MGLIKMSDVMNFILCAANVLYMTYFLTLLTNLLFSPGNKAFVYQSARQLTKHVEDFLAHGTNSSSVDYNVYRDYAPEIVIQQFKKVFLDPVFGV